MNSKAYHFERCIVYLIVNKMKTKGLKHKPVAEKAWPHLSSPSVAWRAIRNAPKTRQPQRITISDTVALCEVVDLSFPELALEAKMLIDQGWTADDFDRQD